MERNEEMTNETETVDDIINRRTKSCGCGECGKDMEKIAHKDRDNKDITDSRKARRIRPQGFIEQ